MPPSPCPRAAPCCSSQSSPTATLCGWARSRSLHTMQQSTQVGGCGRGHSRHDAGCRHGARRAAALWVAVQCCMHTRTPVTHARCTALPGNHLLGLRLPLTLLSLPPLLLAVDEVHYVEDMARVLGALAPPCLHLLSGTNTDRCGPSAGVATCACLRWLAARQGCCGAAAGATRLLPLPLIAALYPRPGNDCPDARFQMFVMPPALYAVPLCHNHTNRMHSILACPEL